MEFSYIISNTVQQYVRHQNQVSRQAFPWWISVLSLALIVGGTAALTYGLFIIFNSVVGKFSPVYSALLSIVPAALIAYNVMVRFVCKKTNLVFLKFARFEMDFEFTSTAKISEQGVFFDEGDRQTHIAWSAIGGVFMTADFIVFYCRGLFYNVPLQDVGTSEQQQALLLACQSWCKAAQGHKTAKLFI